MTTKNKLEPVFDRVAVMLMDGKVFIRLYDNDEQFDLKVTPKAMDSLTDSWDGMVHLIGVQDSP